MLCLKKIWSEDLLHLALLLSLLRIDQSTDLIHGVPLVRVGPRDSWDSSSSLRLLDHRYINPKSVDSILSNYERWLLYDINLLGRYSSAIQRNHDVTAYVGLAGHDIPSTSEFFDDFLSEQFSLSELESTGWTSDEEEEAQTTQKPGDELTQEDMELIEVLWKQDIDMGFSLEEFQTVAATNMAGEEPTAAVAEGGGEPENPKPSSKVLSSPVKSPNLPLLDSLQIKEENSPEHDPWEGLSYTVDLETGEYILKEEAEDSPQGDSLSNDPEPTSDLSLEGFSLEDALQLVGLEDDSFQVGEERSEVEKEVSGEDSDSFDEQLDLLNEMLQVQSPAQTSHYQHTRNIQGGHPVVGHGQQQPQSFLHNQQPFHPAQHHQARSSVSGYRPSSSQEQRWQELASMLAIPHPQEQQYHQTGLMAPMPVPKSQEHLHHHPGFGGPSLGCGGPNMPLITNGSEPMPNEPSTGTSFKVENPDDMMYYQNGTDPNQDGFSSFLGEDDFFMDVSMNEGMYTMRMLENGNGGGSGGHCGTAGAADSDSAVSSMGSERVPSLASDTSDWMETNSDSGQTAVDHFMATPDYHSKYRWYDYNYCRQHSSDGAANTGSGRLPSAPQKKYQLYGKRLFQEQPGSSTSQSVSDNASGTSSAGTSGSRDNANLSVTVDGGNVIPSPIVATPPVPLGVVKYEFNSSPHGPLAPPPPPPYAHSASIPVLPSSPLDMAAKPHISLPEVKYSATLDFARNNLCAARPTPVDSTVHNHTYCMPPEHCGVLQRPLTRDKRNCFDLEDDDVDIGAKERDEEALALSRDERRARALSIPIPVDDIINLPMDEFNERLSKYDLSESQLSLIRDIRRRGKNKVAAQNCRKRKLDQILSLADEVKLVREKKQRLVHERDCLLTERQRIKSKVSVLYRHIFQTLRDDDGNPLNAYQWSLQHTPDGNIVMMPRTEASNGTASASSHHAPHSTKRHHQPPPPEA